MKIYNAKKILNPAAFSFKGKINLQNKIITKLNEIETSKRLNIPLKTRICFFKLFSIKEIAFSLFSKCIYLMCVFYMQKEYY